MRQRVPLPLRRNQSSPGRGESCPGPSPGARELEPSRLLVAVYQEGHQADGGGAEPHNTVLFQLELGLITTRSSGVGPSGQAVCV